jgi:hypothetical protein
VANVDSRFEEVLTQLASQLEAAQNGTSQTAAPAALAEHLAGGERATSATASLTAAVEQLRAINQVEAGVSAQAETSDSGQQPGSGGGSAIEAVGSAVAKVFTSGLGISPLISGLVSLFGGGGDASTPPPLNVYTAPASLHFEGDVHRGANATDWSGSDVTTAPAAATTQQITVQVNAIDSQSFLDHSQDIARAVRQAMLNSNSLNDVVSDL